MSFSQPARRTRRMKVGGDIVYVKTLNERSIYSIGLESFAIHKDLLPASSMLLDPAASLSSCYSCSSKTIYLSPYTRGLPFEIYFNWLYTDRLELEEIRGRPDVPLSFATLWPLWLAGEDLGDALFQNAVMDRMLPILTSTSGPNWQLSESLTSSWPTIELVYANTRQGSPLRTFLVDMFYIRGRRFQRFSSPLGPGCQQFVTDLLQKFDAYCDSITPQIYPSAYKISEFHKYDPNRALLFFTPGLYWVGGAKLTTDVVAKERVGTCKDAMCASNVSEQKADATAVLERTTISMKVEHLKIAE